MEMGLLAREVVSIPILERRAHERRKTRWSIEGSWLDKSIFTAITIDISKAGLQMNTAREFKVGGRAYIKIDAYSHGEHRIIDAIVEVKHASIANNCYNCGVKFLKISKSNLRFIASYIAGRNPHKLIVENSQLPTPEGAGL